MKNKKPNKQENKNKNLLKDLFKLSKPIDNKKKWFNSYLSFFYVRENFSLYYGKKLGGYNMKNKLISFLVWVILHLIIGGTFILVGICHLIGLDGLADKIMCKFYRILGVNASFAKKCIDLVVEEGILDE